VADAVDSPRRTDAFDGLELERRDGVAIITLTTPERRNALTLESARSLSAACEEIDRDDAIGAVVVRGAGGYFCSGGDRGLLAAVGESPADPDYYAAMSEVYGAFRRVGSLKPPTIAAVRGGAVGAGLNLLLATDLRVVARDAKLMSGFMRIGLHQGGGHGHILSRLVGREAAAALTLFGEQIDGERAVELGLAWEAVDDADVDERALALASVPARDPELARRMAHTLRLELDSGSISWDIALELERAAQMWSMHRKFLAAGDE
jgi:enoyl-CoA hydratase